MAFNNNNKMIEAVLLDKDLMDYGQYNIANIPSIFAALDNDNHIVNAVANIIQRADEGATANAIYKEINEYLKRKL